MKSSAGLAGRGLTGAALPAGECGGRAETGLGAVRKGTGSVGKSGQGRAGGHLLQPWPYMCMHVYVPVWLCVHACL